MNEYKIHARGWIERHAQDISDWHQIIWRLAEPAWREYRSAAWYVDRLRKEGFTVEEGSAGMPTAFCAVWENGKGGPTVGAYAEYDATPANSQEQVPYECPREGLNRYAAGHTDPHSALGMGSLAGVLAAKDAMRRYGIPGRIKFFGEPAEKMCGSKPLHAANGYYDDVDAFISFHPSCRLSLCNTVYWDIHCAEQLWPRVHLRVHPPRNVGRGARPYAHAAPAGGGQSPRRARCRVPHVYDQPLHQYLHVASLGRMVYQ